MVRVTIKSEKYDRIAFDFADCEVAGKFLNVAMESAVGVIKVEIEKVVEPAAEPTFEELVDESQVVELRDEMF